MTSAAPLALSILLFAFPLVAQEVSISPQTEECLDCHDLLRCIL